MTSSSNRRGFLKSASALSLSAGLVAAGSKTLVAQEPIKRPAGSMLKLSLNAYSFKKPLSDYQKGVEGGMSLFDLLDFCAEHNFEAVDPTGYFFPDYPKVPSDEFINNFKRRAYELGLDISGTGIANDFCTPDKASRAADVAHIKEWIEVAAKMGAPVIRVFATKQNVGIPDGYTWDQVAQWMAADIRECVEHGKKYGVIVGVQNHKTFIKTTDHIFKLLKLIDSPWCGWIIDTGCFLSDDPYAEIAQVLPYAVNFQVKEKLYGRESNVRTDLPRLFKVLRDGGYRGYIPIETLYMDNEVYDPKERVAKFAKEVREALG